MRDGLSPTELSINFLMRTALKSITTLPFHLVNDLWRWRLFRGEYETDEANAEFWKLKYVGKYCGPIPGKYRGLISKVSHDGSKKRDICMVIL